MAFKEGYKKRTKPETEMKDSVPRTKKSKTLVYPYAEVANYHNHGPGVVVHDDVYGMQEGDETECCQY